MQTVENQCVGCETCTLGMGCSLRHVIISTCDECGLDDAKYHIDGKDYCEECADKYLNQLFIDSFSIPQKAEIIDVTFEIID